MLQMITHKATARGPIQTIEAIYADDRGGSSPPSLFARNGQGRDNRTVLGERREVIASCTQPDLQWSLSTYTTRACGRWPARSRAYCPPTVSPCRCRGTAGSPTRRPGSAPPWPGTPGSSGTPGLGPRGCCRYATGRAAATPRALKATSTRYARQPPPSSAPPRPRRRGRRAAGCCSRRRQRSRWAAHRAVRRRRLDVAALLA